jgi:hypothetical protein
MLRRHPLCFACIALLIVSLSGCARFRNKDKRAEPTGIQSPVIEAEKVDYPATLHAEVARHINAVSQGGDSDRNRIVRRKPYFYKTYSEYGDIPAESALIIQASASRTVPYRADVRITKIRYATELKRKRDQARADTKFIRDTGEETISYEFRSGQWHRVGSLFVADKSEEQLDGEWIAVRRAQPRTLSEVVEQEDVGWFNSVRNKLPWRN